jgi:glycosyltransferase involved in cell wall biosynthesis
LAIRSSSQEMLWAESGGTSEGIPRSSRRFDATPLSSAAPASEQGIGIAAALGGSSGAGSAATPLRLLFLSPFPPRLDGLHGGSRAVARLMLGLADRHRITLLYLRTEGEPDVDHALAERCDLLASLPLDFGRTRTEWWKRRARVAAGLLVGRPRWVSNWTNPAFARRVEEVVADWAPDVVQAESHVMGQYLAVVRAPAVRVLVQHEPGVVAAREQARVQSGAGRIFAALELRSWQRYEAAIMRSAEAVVVFTERDGETLRQLAAGTPIQTIPLGLELPEKASSPIGTAPPRLLFVGNFLHPPNVDAALYLIDSILPRVKQAIPECRLEIVGVSPPAAVRARGDDHILVTGRVRDVQPYLDEAAVVVVPLRLGGGMRVKVLEALAAGKAVVASALAVEGLNVTDGEQLRIASAADEFVAAVVELLRAPQLRVVMGARARTWAAQHLNSSTAVARYERLYRTLSRGPR